MPEPGATGVHFTMVETSGGFRKMLESLLQASRIAIDIEADSLYHYFDKVCLIQISNDDETFVLDPLAIRDLQPLAPIMVSPSVEKVFHAAGYDLHCLRRDYGFTFDRIFDTHIAAQLLGFEHLGLGAILESLLGIAHSKRRQRDDWSRRPLDAEQLEYAAMDTHHLLTLRDLLEEQLDRKGRLAWAREEFAVAAGIEQPERQFDPEGYRRIKGSRALSVQKTAVLRALYALRDRYARKMDLPPFKVINNPVLLDLAIRPPEEATQLSRRPGISHRVARQYAEEICVTIAKAQSDDPAVLARTEPRQWSQPSRETRQRLESLRSWRRNKAAELKLDVGVLCPGNVLEMLAANPPSDLAGLEAYSGMRHWRADEFGREILEVLRSVPA
jgi:ribonuclease D